VYWLICCRWRNTSHEHIKMNFVARGRTIVHRILTTRSIIHGTVNPTWRRMIVRVYQVYASLGCGKHCPCFEGRRQAMKDFKNMRSLSRHGHCDRPEANDQEENAAELHLRHIMGICMQQLLVTVDQIAARVRNIYSPGSGNM
jgi:hypothetical protein